MSAETPPAVENLLDTSDDLGQVTSVSQLSDVQPTDWAFQALQSLIERYGCIAGLSDGTFRGNRATTRYEFAAALNSCGERIVNRFGENLATKEDLATLQALQEAFKGELATLTGRVDNLQTRTENLESGQFSTTTKLQGSVQLLATDVFGDRANSNPKTKVDSNAILSYVLDLNFRTSFTGKDTLTLGISSNNTPSLAGVAGTHMARTALDASLTPGDSVYLSRLFYRFPVGQKGTAWIGPRALQPAVFTPTLNPVVGSRDGSIARFSTFNPTVYRPGFDGAGAAFEYRFSKQAQINLGFIVDDSKVNNPSRGISSGNNEAIVQLTLTPAPELQFALTYARKYFDTNTGFNLTGGNGSANARNPFGQNATSSDNFGLEFNWRASRKFNLGGWFGYTNANQRNGTNSEATILNGALALGFPDLFRKGNLGGILIGVPPKVTSNNFPGAVSRKDRDTSLHFETFYTFRLNDNVTLTPSIYLITAPEHNSANSAIVVGAIRTNFSF